ncbi:MAG: glycosyltransferase family 1 protein [Chloroflexi bacterium]|nr:MAG: glycosyltransferase family 1 protein [Chloroflexota bacterium]MBL1194004.1 glycosyltransferase family 1 protein [Chloroflexota bacterium]NOH11298.1 hypothetical protein [Chloroflexota bacterium]
MTFADKRKLLEKLTSLLAEVQVSSWADIAQVIEQLQQFQHQPKPRSFQEFLNIIDHGTAYLTFAIGLDGVSIEIAKYARALEARRGTANLSDVHLITGDFQPQADNLMKERWHRFKIDGINGWDKWAGGKYFDALYRQDLEESSQISSELAAQIFQQGVDIAENLGDYLVVNNIGLLIPINVASNPGNLALSLALVFVTEALGIFVLNSNHDFYWEGGMPPGERQPGEEPGVRDHFFRNAHHKSFFSLFQSLYPWNGRRWLQVNINTLQSHRLIDEFGFPLERVTELTTSVGDKLLEEFTSEDVKSARLRMAHILSNGKPVVKVRALEKHRLGLRNWMGKQKPYVIGAHKNLSLDLTTERLIYLLQPTRVVARKRIERDVELIHALLRTGPLREEFDADPECRILLHITGPTPREHRHDLSTILQCYEELIEDLPPSIGERVFLAFSVGREEHPVFQEKGFAPLNITDLYRLATAVLFPSETEGRGLPIIESAAIGVPIISSRYSPVEVFDGVIGEHLPEEQRIQYIEFPEGEFSQAFLGQVADLLLRPEIKTRWQAHNRKAIRLRYSDDALRASFQNLLQQLYEISE